MSTPYNVGDRWFIELADGSEIEFVSSEDAWDYYETHR